MLSLGTARDIVLGAFSLAFGLASLGAAGMVGSKQYRILRDWPSVDAEVVRSRVLSYVVHGRRSNATYYTANIEFRYKVGSQSYLTSARPSHDTDGSSPMQHWVDVYSPGTRHQIRYNPVNPADIRFDVGYNYSFFNDVAFLGIWGLIFLVASGVLLVRPRHAAGRPRRGKFIACPSCQWEVRSGLSVCPNCSASLPTSQ